MLQDARTVLHVTVFLVVFILGSPLTGASSYQQQPSLADAERVVKLYLYTVERNEWERAFNQYLHPSFRAVVSEQLLPILTSGEYRPEAKSFDSLNIYWAATANLDDGTVMAELHLTYILRSKDQGQVMEEPVGQIFRLVFTPVGWQIVSMEIMPYETVEQEMLLIAHDELLHIGTAIEIFAIVEGRYPTLDEMLVTGADNILVRKGYLTDFGLDPWRMPYLYKPPQLTTLQRGMLWSSGPNKLNESIPGYPGGDEAEYELYYVFYFPGE